MYVCLQWWLRGPDSCSVVWWSSPSGEGAGGWHPSHWPPSGSPAPLYSLPTSHIPGLNHAVSPCLSPPPHNSTYNTQGSGHTECNIMYTPPPEPACSNTLTKARTHRRQIQYNEENQHRQVLEINQIELGNKGNTMIDRLERQLHTWMLSILKKSKWLTHWSMQYYDAWLLLSFLFKYAIHFILPIPTMYWFRAVHFCSIYIYVSKSVNYHSIWPPTTPHTASSA